MSAASDTMKAPIELLLVEDSEDDAMLLLHALKRGGLKVRHERVDSASALEAALARQPWDAVVSDYNMSGFSGLDALRMVRLDTRDIPFILVSGTVGEETAVNAMKLGAADYVTKRNLARLAPALERELKEAVNRADVRRVQQQLAESEMAWRTMFETGPVAQMLQLPFSTIVNVNDRFVELSGFARSELVGRKTDELALRVDDELSARFRAVVDSNGSVDQMDLRVRRKDGALRHVLISSCRVMLAGAPHQLHSLVDITERRQAVEQARVSQQALAAVSQGVLISGPDRVTLSVNGAFETMTGYRQRDILGRSCSILQGAGTDPLTVIEIREALNQQRPFVGELMNYRKDGSTFWNELSISPVLNEAGALTHFVGIQRDVTERKARQAQARLSAQVFAQGHEAIMVADAQSDIVMVNQAFTAITGYSEAEVLGRNPRLLASGRHDADFYRRMWETVDAEGIWQGEVWNRNKNGAEYLEWLTVCALRDAKGRIDNYVGTFSDISEQHNARERIDWLSNFDTLTGLPNRTLLAERCGHDIRVAQRGSKPIAMLILGLDDFKSVNDSLGHAIGDEVLKQLTQRLKTAVREQDTVARVGGDEFVVVLPGDKLEGANLVALKLQRILAMPYAIDGVDVVVTASVGAAMYPSDGADFGELFKSAELAMYQAKELGRGNVRMFNSEMSAAAAAQMALLAALRFAVARDELELHYQPFVDMQSGQIAGMEALLRWNQPELGAVPPSRFIPLAEQSGLITDIGNWVLRRACHDIRQWLDLGVKVPPVSVNISPAQFRDAALPRQVEDTLREFAIEPRMVCMEVTEGALMEDVVHSEELLQSFRAMGLALSLDDFGTGYSSLSYLKQFPFDKVKIDQSFVRGLSTNPQDAVIAKVVISMAHGLGLRVIAEGVETEAQCDFMRSNVCDEIQGYFFSRPIPGAEMRDLLVSDRRLPAHLVRVPARTRTLLLVDDEPNVVASLRRLLRRDGYQILTASSGPDGLEMLGKYPVDIIVSDQRMPGMTGVEFLRRAKTLYPDTVRIVLSGYTELQSVTDAINEGAVYRFLTKPWDDEQLRSFIKEAFEHKELADENAQLNLKIRTANQELATSNRQLKDVLDRKQLKMKRHEQSLELVREALQCIPVPVLGLDDEGMIALVNGRAQDLLGGAGALLGSEIASVLPDLDALLNATSEGEYGHLELGAVPYRVSWRRMGDPSPSGGRIVTLNPAEATVCT